MNFRVLSVLLAVLALVVVITMAQSGKNGSVVSFKNDVFPIIKSRCLPCHAEDNFNPSELNMDKYESIAKGGKHGEPLKAGNSSQSLLIEKLSEKPPFGDRMPLNSKRKIQEGKASWLTADEIATIAAWVDQGAKNN